MPNSDAISTLAKYLTDYPDDYSVFGGLATSLVLSQQGIPFRETHDADIMVVAKVNDEGFAKALGALLRDGGYKNAYANEKRTAYRFVAPFNASYPKVIEFFAGGSNMFGNLSSNIRKINIEVNDDMLSAIVLSDEVYKFSFSRVITINGLRVVDGIGLIALKSLAYMKNFALFKEGKVHSDSYKKHRRDVVLLISSLAPSDIRHIDLPGSILESCKSFFDVLSKSGSIYKSYKIGIPFSDILASYSSLFL